MKHYQADEFLGLEKNFKPIKLAEEVDKKVDFLYDCFILKRGKDETKDAREDITRQMLLSYQSLTGIDNAIHGILVCNYTLNQLLKAKGYLQ